MYAAKAWLVVFALVLFGGPAWSQGLISLSGNVTDSNGAAISNATVHLINPANNADRTTTTDQRGSYTFFKCGARDVPVAHVQAHGLRGIPAS